MEPKSDTDNKLDSRNCDKDMVNTNSADKRCYYCNETDTQKLKICEYCQNIYHCSKDHQNIHLYGRKDASECSFEDSNQLEEQTEFSASEKISLNGDTQKMARNICFPFRVGDDKLKGRHLIASRDIQTGEYVLIDKPFVQGPPSKSLPCCLQCGKLPKQPLYLCSRCQLPVCDEICEQGDLHRLECDVFSAVIYYYNTNVANKRGKNEETKSENDGCIKPEEIEQLIKTFQISKLDTPSPVYACITPLRMLLKYRKEMMQETMKMRNGEKTKDEVDSTWYRVMQLMDHEEERRKDQKAWMMNHILVVAYIQRLLAVASKVHQSNSFSLFSAKQIHKAIGIMRTNGVKVEGNPKSHSSMIALYPTYSLTNHNCIDCNTRTIKMQNSKNEYVLRLKATSAIKKGDEIFTRYTPPQLMSLRRQFLLQSQWFFSCECRRCQDPTECNTMGNAITCTFCNNDDDKKQFMLPRDPRNQESEWICTRNPSHISTANGIKALIAEIEANIKRLEKEKNPIAKLEEILERYSEEKLHKNHLLLISVREKIIQALIRRRQGLKIVVSQKQDVMSHDQKKNIEKESENALKKQIEHFRSVKAVMEKLDFPKEFWTESLQKMIREEEVLRKTGLI